MSGLKTPAELRAFHGVVNGNPNDIMLSDQTTKQVRLFLGYHIATDLVFNAAPDLGDESIVIDSPTETPVAGNFICIKENKCFEQTELLTVTPGAGTLFTLTLALPISAEYTTAASICLQDCNLNYDCSTTEREYFITPDGLSEETEFDITRMIVSMYHDSAGDDGLFGNLTKLTKGVYIHYSDGIGLNLFNMRENADLRTAGYDVAYTARSGGQGSYGTASRITFGGQDKCGVVIRLIGEDHLSAHVRDDLSDLDYFRIQLQGHLTGD